MAGISVLQIRDGRLINKKDFEISKSDYDSEEEIIVYFVKEYYQMTSDDDIPNEIIFSYKISDEDKEVFEEWLTSKKGIKVKINPKETKKNTDILELATKNSNYHLQEMKVKSLQEIQNNYNETGSYIQEKLGLSKFPHRVECFDISHIQGTHTVASMVSFFNGMPKKSEYKKFKIKTVENGKPDDFQSMREVITRRYSKLLKEGLEFPDLIIIDGGKGQLSSAVEILDELGVNNQDIVSLAKKIEEVFIPNQPIPVLFPTNSQALFFFQRIRDEAHRFAITFHRQLRDKEAVHSQLDYIKGLYLKNKKLLIEKYSSVNKISKLTKEELMLLLSKSQAQLVYDFFNRENENDKRTSKTTTNNL